MAEKRMKKWRVYDGRGEWLTTVFYIPEVKAAEVKRGLVNRDGYPPNITVMEEA